MHNYKARILCGVRACRAEADAARAEGITLLAIGAGKTDEQELRDIASDPDEDHMFYVNEFHKFGSILNEVMRQACHDLVNENLILFSIVF